MKRLVVLACALVFVFSAGAVAGQKAPSKKTMTVSGNVKSVSGSSLVVTANKQDMTFTIDTSTRVVAKGGATKAAAAKEAGKPMTITDVVKDNDRVTVNYQDMGGGTLHATSVRVR